MPGQSPWLAIALAVLAPTGVGSAVVIWLLTRRVEGAKAQAATNTSAVDGFDRLAGRQNEWIERLEADLKAEREARVAAEKEVRRLRRLKGVKE